MGRIFKGGEALEGLLGTPDKNIREVGMDSDPQTDQHRS